MARTSSESSIRKLKPEQATAAHTLDRHVSVTAGPGAGKTFVLVERYLEILRTQKVYVDNIVAITFTNRAANEMRERVRKEVDSLLRMSDGEERRRWLRHKRSLESAVITTIHGFCSRLLHDFPVEANIDPQFTLLDEHQSAMLLEAVVQDSLSEALQRNDEQIIQMAQGLHRGTLAAALGNLYRDYRGEGLSIAEIEEMTAANHVDRATYLASLAELDSQIAVLLSARRLSPTAEEKRAAVAREWPAVRAVLAQVPTTETIARYCQTIEDFRDARPRKGNAPAVEQLDDLLWGDDSADRLRGRIPAMAFDLLARTYALSLIKLLRAIEDRLDSEKQKLSTVDFDDLQLRALKLLREHPEVSARTAARYRFFLVDEFQDTNGLQRELLKQIAFAPGANLFIVGDRKQSIYGFRGADVDVFAEMTDAIKSAGGIEQPLNINFRSRRPLLKSLNALFRSVFKVPSDVSPEDLRELGFVAHEPSQAGREIRSEGPLVELLVTIAPDGQANTLNTDDDTDYGAIDIRRHEAVQLVERITALKREGAKYGDIAILFRALTNVWVYEAGLRRAGIPYQTVQGKGFYQREEIVDLVQLLRFLDNTTDEIALAAVLRSPLCGISDNALLALRCAPSLGQTETTGRLRRRNLFYALRHHQEISLIDEDERAELERARLFLTGLVERRHRDSVSELLRSAVRSAELLPVIASHFDGAQRVANIEKLFRLAEQFEKSGNLIRDFVRYVEEFEAVGGRESEGQMDESADVVRLMTIHQSKGLEFPVVIIPELHRDSGRTETAFLLDRHRGFTTQIPDGRGHPVRGALFNGLRRRNQWREQFESMRLLYVAATRAEDRLILSGAVEKKSVPGLMKPDSDRWLAWVWQALDLPENPANGIYELGDDAEFQVTVGRAAGEDEPTLAGRVDRPQKDLDPQRPFHELFPLLQPVRPELGQSLRRFSVTQLINFQRCARQYYFDRTLRTPAAEERGVWNNADAPEPPANLTATLKGAVIHRFCETYCKGDDAERRLQSSFDHVVAQRQSELAGRVFDINKEAAIRDLMPLAQNYLHSEVFRRVGAATQSNNDDAGSDNPRTAGLWSERRFRLRRPLGILTGTIDKLLITPAVNNDGVDVEIIDFKTNHFAPLSKKKNSLAQTAAVNARQPLVESRAATTRGQASFDFENVKAVDQTDAAAGSITIEDQIRITAGDYRLQMQAYALALRELLTSDGEDDASNASSNRTVRINTLRATLHFIDPNIEFTLPAALVDGDTCARAIDEAMSTIAALDGILDVDSFAPFPAAHCRVCNFLELCPAGRDWVRSQSSKP